MSDLRAALKRYISEDRVVLPIPHGQKATRLTDWSNEEVKPTEDDFGPDDGIAERLDTITDVDCDTSETRALAPRFLLNTGRVHGRPSLGASHFWYDAPGSRFEQFLGLDKKPLVEIRTDSGHYTLLPPSVVMTKGDNPVPESLYWERDREPGKVNAAGLRESVCLLATAALLCRHWPAGSRHNATLAISGMMANLDVPAPAVEELLKGITFYCEREEWSEIGATVAATFAAKKAGKAFTGGPELAKLLEDGDAVVKRIRGWYGKAAAGKHHDIVEELNAKHFLIRVGSHHMIGTDQDGAYIFQRPESLRLLYANQLVPGKRMVKGVEVDTQTSKFDIWLRHPKRREFGTITFAPPPIVPNPKDLNLWRGFTIEPKAGDCSKLLWHAKHIICSDVDEHYEYLLDLLALGVQRPGDRSEVSTVLRGGQGAGKGIFIRAYGEIFGRHFIHLDKPEQLTGKFNAHLSGAVVVFADEAFFAGDPTMDGPLKRLITEPTIQVERKGIDQVSEPNCVKLFMATNRDRAVPAAVRERRHFVLHVSDAKAQNHDYFEALREEIDNGGREALLHFLLERRFDRKSLRRAPDTDALREQQDFSLNTELTWYKECLALESIGSNPWPTEISAEALHLAYIAWCEEMKINRRVSTVALGKRLKKVIPDSGLKRDTRTRGRIWCLGPVALARATFDRETLGPSKTWGWEPEGEPQDAQFVTPELQF
jgi:Family of unknown function (DUF5906)